MAGSLTSRRDARVARCGIYSAWLMKEKGDHAYFQPSCRRYFTIDFDSRTLFYSPSELDKYLSAPIPFKEILWASLAEEAPAGSAVGSARITKQATGSSSSQRRLGFVVETCQRRIRLVTDSEDDAKLWVDSLNAARFLGQQDETSCKVGLSRFGWGVGSPPWSPTSIASRSTADGSMSSSSSRSVVSSKPSSRPSLPSRRTYRPTTAASLGLCLPETAEEADQAFATTVSPRDTRETRECCGGFGNEEDLQADADILDVLLRELQDDEESQGDPGSPPGRLESSELSYGAVSRSRCQSPWMDPNDDAAVKDTDVLEVLLQSLVVGSASDASIPTTTDGDEERMWAAPGWLHRQTSLSESRPYE